MYVSVCTLVSRYVSRDLRFPKSKQSTAKLSSCKLGGFLRKLLSLCVPRIEVIVQQAVEATGQHVKSECNPRR